MKRLYCLFLFVTLFLGLANSQTAKVKGNTVVHKSASATSARITTLAPPATVTLISSRSRNGFLHVQTDDGDKGWVLASSLEVLDTGDSNEKPASGDLLSQLLAVHVDAVGQPLIENGQTVCGPTGDAKNDRARTLNQNKNRTDIPNSYVPIDFDVLRDLPSDQSNDLPGAPVVVEGFLVHRVKVENDGSGESTNCHLLGDDEVDWHIYLSDTAGKDDISTAVIVETTPRTRPLHKWVKSDLDAVVNKNTPVRISGWLIYDYEHVGVIGTQRASVWEVHPITKIEVQRGGQWVDLDQ